MISRAVEAEVLRLHHAERWPIARQLLLHPRRCGARNENTGQPCILLWYRSSNPMASRSCCSVQAALGLAVTLQ
jgi:hypothetical protein